MNARPLPSLNILTGTEVQERLIQARALQAAFKKEWKRLVETIAKTETPFQSIGTHEYAEELAVREVEQETKAIEGKAQRLEEITNGSIASLKKDRQRVGFMRSKSSVLTVGSNLSKDAGLMASLGVWADDFEALWSVQKARAASEALQEQLDKTKEKFKQVGKKYREIKFKNQLLSANIKLVENQCKELEKYRAHETRCKSKTERLEKSKALL
ncbi:hypothetical protein QBC38DRAFT_449280 [Podospora fimiseda]|uniref:Uncharacterized protein n=1 Tax=Podospora fimiseda TaxID=252190 RepID=A0AAN6YM86_9PEZI|nr:hypothetical protein QBC38DRAFT_449280 [Podospora fimiseda]